MPKNVFKKTSKFPDDIVINILSFIKQNGLIIILYDFKQKKFIDTENPDYTRAKILVQTNGYNLQYIDIRFKTNELYKLAVQQNGYALYIVEEQTE